MTGHPFARIIVPRPLRSVFTYAVPADLDEAVLPGRRVVVPFGTRQVIGLVAERIETADVETKEILQVVDGAAVVPPDLLELALWTSRHYFAGPGEVLGAVMPKGDIAIETVVSLADGAAAPDGGGERLRGVFDRLVDKGGSRRFDLLRADLKLTADQLTRLLTGPRGKELFARSQRARTVIHRSVSTTDHAPAAGSLPTPTPEQEDAIAAVAADIAAARFAVTLLFGVTGSGKTEVYAHLIARTLATGKGALALAPEIALADMLAARLKSRLGVEPLVIHSDMTPRDRAARIDEALTGKGRLVVGARSAVFAPVADLGLIIVDEEHDATYKQENAPRYHGRDVAVKRGSLAGVPVVLGSATPSMESYHNATTGRYRLVELKERVDGRPLPKVELVTPDYPGSVGPRLDAAIKKRLAAGEQTLLFLNRRGASRYLMCGGCGHVFECKNCSISLVHHAAAKSLRCHTCGYEEREPTGCPKCSSDRYVAGGAGSERLETEIAERYPTARIVRIDRDTTAKRGASADLLAKVAAREVDILIGTQMVTKGHDLHGVTLVGAISADDSLCIPDFRAAERTFQLITQAAGRAGRGTTPGEVIVQAMREGGHGLRAALNHDYAAFYAVEAPLREIVGYPPFVRLAAVRIEAASEGAGRRLVELLRPMIGPIEKEAPGVTLLGPEEAVVFKVKNRYHWRLLIKGADHQTLARGVRAFLDRAEPLAAAGPGAIRLAVDMDPATTL